MAHDRDLHWAICQSCGWKGLESELLYDKNHRCGKDQCPDCNVENVISCCFHSEIEVDEFAAYPEGTDDFFEQRLDIVKLLKVDGLEAVKIKYPNIGHDYLLELYENTKT